MQKDRINLKGLPKHSVTSQVDAVRKRTNGDNEFIIWSLPIDVNPFRRVTQDVITPAIGGNSEKIDTTNVVKATFDVYTLPSESEYPEAWFLQSVTLSSGEVVSYEYGDNELDEVEL